MRYEGHHRTVGVALVLVALLGVTLLAVGAGGVAASDEQAVEKPQVEDTAEDAFFDVAIEGIQVDIPEYLYSDADADDRLSDIEISVFYAVENTGGAPDTQDVSLAVSPELTVVIYEDHHEVSIDPGDVHHDRFVITGEEFETFDDIDSSICLVCEPIHLTFTVASEDDSDSETVVLEPGGDDPPQFEIDHLSVTEPTEGEDLAVAVGITNVGDVTDSQEVVVEAGELGSESQLLLLPGGESVEHTVTFPTEPGDSGTYDIGVQTRDDTAATTATVAPANGAESNFEVDIESVDLDLPPLDPFPLPPVEIGLTVDYSVENTGEAADSQDIVLDIEEHPVDSQEVTLDPDDTHEGTFEYRVGVLDEDDVGILAGATDSADFYEVLTEVNLIPEPPYLPEVTVGVSSEDDRDEETIVLEPGEEPRFQIDDVDVVEPVAGDDIAVAVQVTNDGDIVDTQTVTADAGPLGASSALQLLGPGESAVVDLTIPTDGDDAGTYGMSVTAGEDQVSTELTVHEPEGEAQFDVAIEDVRVDIPTIGDPGRWSDQNYPVTVETDYTVDNTGDAGDTQEIIHTIEGDEYDSESVSLDAGDSHSGTFSATVPVHAPYDAAHLIPEPPFDPEITVGVSSDDDRDTETVSLDPGEDPGFEITALETNDPVEGEELVVAVEVTNNNDFVDWQVIDIDAGPLGSDSTLQLLGAGETVIQHFTIDTTVGDAGTYDVSAATGSDTASTTAIVHESEDGEAVFDVDIEHVDVEVETPIGPMVGPFDIDADIEITTEYVVENVGEASDGQDIVFELEGTPADNETVHLDAGERHEGTFVHEMNLSDVEPPAPPCVAPHEDTCLPHTDVSVVSEDDSDTETVIITPGGGILPTMTDQPPLDLTADGLHEDVRGDGEVGIFDVQTLFQNLDNDDLQASAELFNFQGQNPEEVTIFDVQALFERV